MSNGVAHLAHLAVSSLMQDQLERRLHRVAGSARAAHADFGGKGAAPVDRHAPLQPVEIAGVRVGQVSRIGLDDTFRARVDLDLDSKLKLPVDSSAAIVTAGILGDRYIQLTPGAEDETLKPGEQIAYTESALVLERLIGKFLVNIGDKSGDKAKDPGAADSGSAQ